MGQTPSQHTPIIHRLNKHHDHQEDHRSHHYHHHDHHQDVEEEDYHQILPLVNLSKNINKRDRQGMTLLHHACEQGHWRITDLLLQLGADPALTSLSNHGNTNALILAAAGGHAACLRRLLAFGVSTQLADSWGNTALFKAACYNHVDCVAELLRNGADPDVSNKWGALPIQYAAHQGHHHVVALLIQAGADVTAAGESSTPPALEGALVRGHYKCFEPLLDEALSKRDPVSRQGLLRSLLRHLISAPDDWGVEHVNLAGLLLRRGADLDPETLWTLADKVRSGVDTNVEMSLVQVLLLSLYPESTQSEALADLFRTFSQIQPYGRRCLDLILNTGYRPPIEEIRDLATLTSDDISILERGLTEPRSLYECSRLVIRKCLGRSIFHKIDRLPLPRAVKDDLRLMPTLHRVSWLAEKPARTVKVE